MTQSRSHLARAIAAARPAAGDPAAWQPSRVLPIVATSSAPAADASEDA